MSLNLLPFRSWLGLVDRHSLRADALAGLVGAVAVLPQGVAFALLAGLPPAYGLYCAMVPTVVAALFGSSLHAMSGPTTAVSLMVLAVLSPLAAPGSAEYVQLAMSLSFLCGLTMMVLAFARMGSLVNFMSDAVVVGFTSAIGVLIMASQLPALLGLQVTPGAGFSGTLAATAAAATQVQWAALATAAGTLACGLALRRRVPKIPPLLGAITAGSLLAALFNGLLGAEHTGLRMVGELHAALPPFSIPDLSAATIEALTGPTIVVTVLALTQGISIERAIALRSGQRLDNNQEFFGQGLANLVGSFFSSYPSTASVNRCALNFEAGARTPLSAVFSALILLAMVATLGWMAAWIPAAAIAGALVMVAWGLLDFRYVRHALKSSASDAAVVGITFVATLLFDLEYALLSGVAASLAFYLNRTAHPSLRSLVPDTGHPERKMMEVRDGATECPQMKLLRIEGSIYFGACEHVGHYLDWLRRERPGQKHLVLMSKSINTVDLAGADLIGREAQKRNAAGGGLYMYSPRVPVEAILERTGYMKDIGQSHIFRSKDETIAGVFAHLDRATCRRCRARIFLECRSVPGPEGEPLPAPTRDISARREPASS